MQESGALPAQRARRSYADVVLASGLLAVVALMIVPIPTPLLDVLIVANLAIAVVMLLCSVAVKDGLAFTTMPTLLLCTTLYRLALNVSSTRLILLQADAGRVIRAFGDFVVRGDYAVGAAVFFILTLIQYVVVARGSERVAEVGARFTLDAMPGKQLAIDADLRAGALNPEAARAARRTLERESQFYGAMDGAMKFVKGDAIAGIVITFVNVIAGLAIGVGMRKLSALESLRVYGLLTIGDGLVCQIPSLLISTGAGLVVTRVAAREADTSLASELAGQLFADPNVLALAAVFLGVLALVPGLPGLPFGLLALALFAASSWRRRALVRAEANGWAGAEHGRAPRPVTLALGPDLFAELERAASTQLAPALEHLCREFERELGLPLPSPALRNDVRLAARGFAIELHELPLAQAELADGEDMHALFERVASALRRHAAELIDLQGTQRLLDALERDAPAIVHNTVPKPVSLRLLADVLRRLLAEGVSIRPLGPLLETLADAAAQKDQPSALVDRVRLRLCRQIALGRARDGVLALHAVDPLIEDALRDAKNSRASAFTLALPPDQARDIVRAVRRAAEAHKGVPVTLVTQPDVRQALRDVLESELHEVAVLSYAELPSEARIEQRAPIRIT